jgi:hypothetical protein
MGATGWKASLLCAGRNVSRRHKTVLGLAAKNGFQAPVEFQPWAFDSDVVALVTWETENPIYLYGVESRRALRVQSGNGFPSSVQFAPDIDRILISFASSCRVDDGRGVNHFHSYWSMVDADAPFLAWLPRARFLWVGREVTDDSIVIRVHSALDGSLLETQRLDPEDAAPYDRAPYERISRSNFTLRFSARTWSVGSLLDRWHQIRFDRATGQLLLSVLRPVSEPYEAWPGLVCDVEERWVAATLASS